LLSQPNFKLLQTKDYLKELLLKQIQGTISQTEKQELFKYTSDNNYAEVLKKLIYELSEETEIKAEYKEEKWEGIIQQILAHKQAEIIPLKNTWARRWWAAAAAVVVLGTGGYFYFNKTGKENQLTEINQLAKNDVAAPKNNRATITLANGQKVFLDSAANGTLATQGNIQIKKSGDGIIEYNGNGQPKKEIEYNTLTNPRGSKVIDITLSDGTQVWLNAESSLKYPVAFTGNERQVEITGEAYFEVTHNEKKPFIVKKNETEVQVLGTHFNVNAFDDESAINITLLQGSVKVSKGNNKQLLHPGEQAQVSSLIKINKTIDTADVMSWKNGRFLFSNADIKTIMRQMSRWYDVEVTYQDDIPDTYTVTVPRNVPVSQLFHYIQLSGGVHFDIDGKKITVRK
jgi:transmembrane sensor